jgi:hypothetical protein
LQRTRPRKKLLSRSRQRLRSALKRPSRIETELLLKRKLRLHISKSKNIRQSSLLRPKQRLPPSKSVPKSKKLMPKNLPLTRRKELRKR